MRTLLYFTVIAAVSVCITARSLDGTQDATKISDSEDGSVSISKKKPANLDIGTLKRDLRVEKINQKPVHTSNTTRVAKDLRALTNSNDVNQAVGTVAQGIRRDKIGALEIILKGLRAYRKIIAKRVERIGKSIKTPKNPPSPLKHKEIQKLLPSSNQGPNEPLKQPPVLSKLRQEQGSAKQGTAEHGSAEHGSAEQGSAEQGSAKHDSAEQGSAKQGSAKQGSAHHWRYYDWSKNRKGRQEEEPFKGARNEDNAFQIAKYMLKGYTKTRNAERYEKQKKEMDEKIAARKKQVAQQEKELVEQFLRTMKLDNEQIYQGFSNKYHLEDEVDREIKMERFKNGLLRRSSSTSKIPINYHDSHD